MNIQRQIQGVQPKFQTIETKGLTIINLINHLLVIGIFLMVLSVLFNSSPTDSISGYRNRAALMIRAGL